MANIEGNLISEAYFNGKNGTKFKAVFTYNLENQNVEGNYSTIRYRLYFQSLGYSGSGSTVYGRINGVNVGTCTSIAANEIKFMGSKDEVIYHNTDGIFPGANYSYVIDTPWTLGDAAGSGQLGYNTIPFIARASTVSVPRGSINRNIPITIYSNSGSFTHNLTFSFGSLTGVIGTGLAGGAHNWTVPNNFYSQIPNATSGQGVITVDTYSNGGYIGSSSTTLYLDAVESECRPSISGTVQDSNDLTYALTGDRNKFIRGMSNAAITATATAKNWASISRVNISCDDGKSSDTSTVTFEGVESGDFTLSAFDSRGYGNSTRITKTLIPYVKLSANVSISRETSTGSKAYMNISGNYFSGSLGATNNSLTVKYAYKEESGSYSEYKTLTATINNDNTYTVSADLGNNFDYRKQYTFNVIIEDKLITTGGEIKLSEGVPMLGLFKDHVENFGTETIISNNEKVMFNVDMIYPVGSIYMSVNPTNPGELFGGTWERWGNGRVPVGVNEDDLLGMFETSEKAGGTVYQELRALIGAFDSNAAKIGYKAENKVPYYDYNYSFEHNNLALDIPNSRINNTTLVVTPDGSNATTVQPYITCYMWKRTA